MREKRNYEDNRQKRKKCEEDRERGHRKKIGEKRNEVSGLSTADICFHTFKPHETSTFYILNKISQKP